MQRSGFLLFCLLSIFLCTSLNAKIVKDTLRTNDGDRVILSYDKSQEGNTFTIQFNTVRTILGSKNSSAYKDLQKVAVMFFDKKGSLPKNVSIKGLEPKPFMVPVDATYDYSSDGYFVISDHPSISFTVKNYTEVNIPIYLAYHAKKGKYELFSQCKALNIKLQAEQKTKQPQQVTKSINQTITSTTEVESSANEEELNILESISRVRTMLLAADKLPFSETLNGAVSFLRQKSYEVKDKNLLSNINEVLDEFEAKKAHLEANATAEQKAEQQRQEQLEKNAKKAEQARQDSIQHAQELAAEKDKRNNMWMIIGGIILGIFAFVGNQLFQNHRNNRNQKKMEDMQKSISAKAEADAKRMARNASRTARNNAYNQAADTLRKTKSTFAKNITKQGKSQSKDFSI